MIQLFTFRGRAPLGDFVLPFGNREQRNRRNT